MPTRGLDEEAASAASTNRGFDVLWERVGNQDRAIRALAEETTSSFRDVSASIKGLDQKLDVQAKSTADAGRPQYAALFGGMLAAISVAVGVIQWQNGLRDKPVDDKMAAMTLAIQDLAHNTSGGFADISKNYISRSEYATAVDFRTKLNDLTNKYNDQLITRMQSQIDKVEASEVSRAEHVVHWDAISKRDSEIQGEIAALGTRLDQLAPASDVIKRLTESEHELEMKVYGGAK